MALASAHEMHLPGGLGSLGNLALSRSHVDQVHAFAEEPGPSTVVAEQKNA